MEFESFIQKFTNLKDLGNRQFRSACPVCEKNVPNGHHLYIKQGDFGIILLNCKKGCSVDTICSEIQISLKDLFPN